MKLIRNKMNFFKIFRNNNNQPRLKIVVAGMPQSGSTFIYNLLSDILDSYSINFNCYLFGHKNYRKVVNSDYLIKRELKSNILIKEHHYEPFLKSWADIIILTKRDIRDSIASRRRRKKVLISKAYKAKNKHNYDPTSFEGFKEWCKYITKDCIEDWGKVDYLFDYESQIKDKLKISQDLNEILREKTYIGKLKSPDLDKTIQRTLDIKNNRFDMKTKVTSNQGASGTYKKNLNKKEIEFIENNYSNWLKN